MSEAIEIHLQDAEATRRLGVAIGRLAEATEVIALVGELGAGKTTLVRGLAGGLGVEPHAVSSPTFVLMHEHEVDGRRGLAALVHIDAYRLSSAQELSGIGWDDGGGELRERAIVVIEWADRVAGALPEDRLEIELIHNASGRLARFRVSNSWRDRLSSLKEVHAE
ncbi:MAG: tRNA (adenosine(37)-N6)-threonylcarbamoyltransferase complex ATPase subunit type 1 TsaE [Phycisphaeraceae bacterium]